LKVFLVIKKRPFYFALPSFKNNKKKDMTTAQAVPFKNFRDAILEMYEVGESVNVFGYAHRLCLSLRLETITTQEFGGLVKELECYCENFKIKTSNELVSLF
jgi:hypothetical protein